MLPGATCPVSQPQSQLSTSDRECGVQRNGRRGTLHTWHHAQPTSTRPHHGSDRGQSTHRRQHTLGGAQEKHPSQDVTGVRRRARPAWDVSGGARAVLRGWAGAGVCRAWGDGWGAAHAFTPRRVLKRGRWRRGRWRHRRRRRGRWQRGRYQQQSSAISYQPSAISHHQPSVIISHQSSAISNQPSAISHESSVIISHQSSSAIRHPPSVICHQPPSAIHTPVTDTGQRCVQHWVWGCGDEMRDQPSAIISHHQPSVISHRRRWP